MSEPWKSLPPLRKTWWFLLEDDETLTIKGAAAPQKPLKKNGGQLDFQGEKLTMGSHRLGGKFSSQSPKTLAKKKVMSIGGYNITSIYNWYLDVLLVLRINGCKWIFSPLSRKQVK